MLLLKCQKNSSEYVDRGCITPMNKISNRFTEIKIYPQGHIVVVLNTYYLFSKHSSPSVFF